MKYVHNGNPNYNQGAYDWKANKASTTIPVITGEKMIDGVKHYVSESGSEYVAETFDRMFSAPKGKVKPKGTPYVKDKILY